MRMFTDVKEIIIRLMQHPISRKPISKLSDEEMQSARDMIKDLIDFSIEDDFTQFDYIQMARLQCALGELNYQLGDGIMVLLEHQINAVDFLQRGGFDLSMRKWLELVSIRMK